MCAYASDLFEDMSIVIREHILEFKLKNPEYLINGEIGDRKGIHSEKGITDAFKRGVEQGCRIIVLDLDKHMSNKLLHPTQIAKYIAWRPDFVAEVIHTCYVVYTKAGIIKPRMKSAYQNAFLGNVIGNSQFSDKVILEYSALLVNISAECVFAPSMFLSKFAM